MESAETFLEVNDQIRRMASAGSVSETWEFFCECPDSACHVLVSMTLAEFDDRRGSSPALPILGVHHDGLAA